MKWIFILAIYSNPTGLTLNHVEFDTLEQCLAFETLAKHHSDRLTLVETTCLAVSTD
tara:strand:- start:108523 stop:108693 length:171 start_codon:yes stop_codon:yes gene_type:complete